MAKKPPPPKQPKGGGKKTPELPWVGPNTKNTRVCKCGAVNWGNSPTCRSCG